MVTFFVNILREKPGWDIRLLASLACDPDTKHTPNPNIFRMMMIYPRKLFY